MGGDQNSERKKTADLDRSLYGLCQLEQFAQYAPSGEQVFALEEDDDQEEEMFAVVDRQQWNTQRAAEPPLSPELQQMFALARAWATKCDQSHAGSTPLDRHRALAKLRIGIIALHLNHATTPGLSV